ncbi:MAG: hypothetical protein CTY33_02825 [Methylotenera sp.]|nr:MAG: hypothetical protein CTY33_02825 [Methylotenera sp.]
MALENTIQEVATALQIPYLVHFTRTEHLPSIMNHGLYPVSRHSELPVGPTINDIHRFDGHLDATSLSIAHPNSPMFYKCRRSDDEVSWSVLILKPSLLWMKQCAFCRHNAADNRIRLQDLNQLQTSAALSGMYDDGDGILLETRASQSLKHYDPTDVQAEVLVLDIIEPAYIHAVVFDTHEAKTQHAGIMGERKSYVNGKSGLFSQRTYLRDRMK